MAEKPQPVRVLYCAACSLPVEYCEFAPNFEKCKPWLIQNALDLYPDLTKDSNSKEEDKVTEQLKSTSISASASVSASSAPKHEEVKRLTGGKIKKKEKQGVGAIFTFNSSIGRVAKIAIAEAVKDVNSDSNILHGTELNITMDNSNCSRYGVSPFEYAIGESGGSLQLAIVNARIKWPTGPNPPYPEALHKFVMWMLQPQTAVRPCIDGIIIYVDKFIAKFS